MKNAEEELWAHLLRLLGEFRASKANDSAESALERAALRLLASVKKPFDAHLRRFYRKKVVLSIKECTSWTDNIKILLVACDINCPFAARKLEELITKAAYRGIPVIRCSTRAGIGQVFGRTKQISCAGILDFTGNEDLVEMVIMHALRCVAVRNGFE